MYICKDCFLDEELRSEINANAVINGVCDVCGKEGKLMDFSDFMVSLMLYFHYFP